MLSSLKRTIRSSALLSRMTLPLYTGYRTWMSARPLVGRIPRFDGDARLPRVKLTTLSEYQRWSQEQSAELQRRERAEQSLMPRQIGEFATEGYCALCERVTVFKSSFDYPLRDSDGRAIPNLREHLVCVHCRLKNRVRAALQLFLQEFVPEPGRPVYISEQLTRTYRWLRGRLHSVNGSEYLGDEVPLGASLHGIRNEDLGRLTWSDGAVDFMLSFDVLEHVPNAGACFREMCRCLCPGGRLLFTVPTNLDRHETTVRAVMEPNGSIRHLLEPEYHGGNLKDPSQGTLCFRYFGWDVLSHLQEAGFAHAEIWLYWSQYLGYMGGTQCVIAAYKN